jgi:PPK2 family polyphosphate:nucleotide phosphotransferase
MDITKFLVKPDSRPNLSKISTSFTDRYESKKHAKKDLKKNIKKMQELQNTFYAFDRYALLLVFQAMDAAGKDSTIKHVMSGLNPQGTEVFSFKQPSTIDLDHDYLWRINKCLPERGRIGIFNRSHYEEVLVVRVHDLIKNEKISKKFQTQNIWKQRFQQINNFEKYLYENGIIILKFFLHVSKEEQKQRFLDRINDPSKNWKFSPSDLKERELWDEYQKAYQEAISATSKHHAPWYVIPADKKWFMRLAVSEVIIQTMKKLKMEYPKLSEDQLKQFEQYKKILEEM